MVPGAFRIWRKHAAWLCVRRARDWSGARDWSEHATRIGWAACSRQMGNRAYAGKKRPVKDAPDSFFTAIFSEKST